MVIKRLHSTIRFFLIFILAVLFVQENYAVTLVYNLRVRRAFTVAASLERMKKRWLITVVPIMFSRKSRSIDERTSLDVKEKRRAVGTLFNIRYVHSKHWWAEATMGIELDRGRYKGSDPFHHQKFGLDDMVFSGGYRHFFGDKWQLVGYSIIGIPVQRSVSLFDRRGPFLGTRVYNIGCGLEGSYSFINELKRSCAVIVQGRFIHGFNRSWFPILPQDAKIQPGNFSDILCTLNYRERRILIELGYDLTIFSNQAILLKTETIKTDMFLRHSGYATVSYAFLKGLFGNPCLFGAGLNISRSKKFDARTLTAWLYGTVVF